MSTGTRIILEKEDEWWVITDEETGVTTQGESRTEALENLDEAVALYKGEIGHEPTDEELRELGWDPPDHHDTDPRTVVVPRHDRLKLGTLRQIADDAGAKDFDRFCRWIDRNR